MSTTSSPPAFADPLAEEGALPPPSRGQRSQRAGDSERARQGPIARERTALLAPDLEGRLGADAIGLVRSKGLIAAIETVELDGDSRQGLVVDQDPPAGTPMIREGVLTLQVAQTPPEPQDIDDDDLAARDGLPASGTPASDGSDGSEDDTEEWFATLGPTLGHPGLEAVDASPPPTVQLPDGPFRLPGGVVRL